MVANRQQRGLNVPTAPLFWLNVAIAKGLIREPECFSSPRNTVAAPRHTDTVSGEKATRFNSRVSEKRFQSSVVMLAKANGWRTYHTRDSRRSPKGFPDLCLVRRGVLVFAELKRARGRFTQEQREWLELLEAVPGVLVCRWRPADWTQVVATLTAAPGAIVESQCRG